MSTLKSFNKEVVLSSAQYEARKAAGTLEEGVVYSISDYQEPVQDVQIKGTSILTDGVANIPNATDSAVGLAKGGGNGIRTQNGGELYIVAAQEANITAKTSSVLPIVPQKLDIAIREGLGNNALTWSDAYKSSARNTIGACSLAEYDSTAASYEENVLYYVVED